MGPGIFLCRFSYFLVLLFFYLGSWLQPSVLFGFGFILSGCECPSCKVSRWGDEGLSGQDDPERIKPKPNRTEGQSCLVLVLFSPGHPDLTTPHLPISTLCRTGTRIGSDTMRVPVLQSVEMGRWGVVRSGWPGENKTKTKLYPLRSCLHSSGHRSHNYNNPSLTISYRLLIIVY
jgi:hypothetical protein